MFNYAVEIIKKITSTLINTSFWNNALKFILACWLYFAGIHTYIYCILALTVIDVTTGIFASLKRGEKFKSRILRKGLVEKVLLYNLMLISIFILELIIKTGFNYSTFYLVLVATVCIATYEISSILENVLTIRPELSFINRLIKLTNKIQDKAVNIAENKVDRVSDLGEKIS